MDNLLVENLIKLGMVVLIGGIVGAEREFHDKAACFRTIIRITVGSALFTIFSLSLDPGFTRTRIAANIVTGLYRICSRIRISGNLFISPPAFSYTKYKRLL